MSATRLSEFVCINKGHYYILLFRLTHTFNAELGCRKCDALSVHQSSGNQIHQCEY